MEPTNEQDGASLPISRSELDAFTGGLSFYLSRDRPEPQKMEIGLAIVKDKLDNPQKPDFYQLFDQYVEQGHSSEEAEDMAWKIILGRGCSTGDELYTKRYWRILKCIASSRSRPWQPHLIRSTYVG